ncbi:MAG TPA: glycoside hydrolase family 5 protein [Cyclobacteriaceae bacterium]|nr:glycoside hydrolase family 5 protein [Cyclobacteriaceae bacterium]
MKLNLICLTLLAMGLSPSAYSQSKSNQKNASFSDKQFTIKRGTNIAHWLSQSDKRGQERAAFFTRKDIDYILAAGFDHIRLPIDEEQLWDESGKRNAEAFELLKHSLQWCQEAGLRAVVDLHILRSHHFNKKEKPLWTVPAEQDKFIALWKDLSGFLHEWPRGMVAYELMNEPVADDPEQWNTLVAKLVDSIRQWEPGRMIVIGSNRWQSANTFDKLRIPKNDRNILLSFHFYEPFFLTHYQASWTNLKDFKGDVNYPGQIVLHSNLPEHQRVYNRDTLLKMMQKPLHLADSLKLPLYCGEFGVIDKAPRESKLAWYRDMVSIFEEKGIAYANWNFKAGSFGIVDAQLKPDLPMVKILTHGK